MGPCKSKSGVSETSKKSKFTFYKGYKTCDDLVNFDDFFGPDVNPKSECKKCLTKEKVMVLGKFHSHLRRRIS